MAEQKTFLKRCASGAKWTGEKISNFPLRVEVHHKDRAGVGGWIVKEGLAIAAVAGMVAVGVMTSGVSTALSAAAYTAAGLLGLVNFADDFRRVTDSFERRTISKMQTLQEQTGLSKEQTLALVETAKEEAPKTSPILATKKAVEPLTRPVKQGWADYVLNRGSDQARAEDIAR